MDGLAKRNLRLKEKYFVGLKKVRNKLSNFCIKYMVVGIVVFLLINFLMIVLIQIHSWMKNFKN